jgi:hypothetical protein
MPSGCSTGSLRRRNRSLPGNNRHGEESRYGKQGSLRMNKPSRIIQTLAFLLNLCKHKSHNHPLQTVQQWTRQAGLRLHPEKTRIVDSTQPGGFDFLGYHLEHGRKRPRRKSLKLQRCHPGEDPKKQRAQPILHHPGPESNVGRMVCLFSAQPSFHVHHPGWLDSHATAQYASPPPRSAWARSWPRQQPVAQRLLRGTGLILLSRSPCCCVSILSQVKPPTGEPCAGNPPARFGGRGRLHSPYPYRLKFGSTMVLEFPLTAF